MGNGDGDLGMGKLVFQVFVDFKKNEFNLIDIITLNVKEFIKKNI